MGRRHIKNANKDEAIESIEDQIKGITDFLNNYRDSLTLTEITELQYEIKEFKQVLRVIENLEFDLEIEKDKLEECEEDLNEAEVKESRIMKIDEKFIKVWAEQRKIDATGIDKMQLNIPSANTDLMEVIADGVKIENLTTEEMTELKLDYLLNLVDTLTKVIEDQLGDSIIKDSLE